VCRCLAYRRSGVIALRESGLFAALDATEIAGAVTSRDVAVDLVGQIGAIAAGVGSLAPEQYYLMNLRGLTHSCLFFKIRTCWIAFRNAVLSELEEYDHRHATGLIPTFKNFLATGGKWEETAKALNLPVNSLRYRLDRVEAPTGRNLDDTGDRVDLWPALEGWIPTSEWPK
jgi:hypothetical protein